MSCCNCLLYDFGCVQRYGSFMPDVQEERLIPYIQIVVETDIIPTIGQACYDWLCDARESVSGFSEIQQQFFNRLQPVIAFATRLSFLSDPGELHSAGYVIETGGGFEHMQRKDQQAARERAENYMRFYRNDLLLWLGKQSEIDIPCLEPCEDCCEPNNKSTGYLKLTTFDNSRTHHNRRI